MLRSGNSHRPDTDPGWLLPLLPSLLPLFLLLPLLLLLLPSPLLPLLPATAPPP